MRSLRAWLVVGLALVVIGSLAWSQQAPTPNQKVRPPQGWGPNGEPDCPGYPMCMVGTKGGGTGDATPPSARQRQAWEGSRNELRHNSELLLQAANDLKRRLEQPSGARDNDVARQAGEVRKLAKAVEGNLNRSGAKRIAQKQNASAVTSLDSNAETLVQLATELRGRVDAGLLDAETLNKAQQVRQMAESLMAKK